MDGRHKQTYLQRKHIDDQQTHEKTNISNYQIKANKNYNQVSPNTSQNDLIKKFTGEGVEKKEPFYTPGGNVN